jgi:hypothetical protein
MNIKIGIAILIIVILFTAVFCKTATLTTKDSAANPPLEKWQISEMETFEKIARRIQVLAGEGWEFSLQRADKLRCWEKKVKAYELLFRHNTIKVINVPMSFRFTITTGLNFPGRYIEPETEQADPDISMGASDHNAWFYSPETYVLFDSGQKWHALLEAVREEFVIPADMEGIQCRAEPGDEIFYAGKPVELEARLRNISGRILDLTDRVEFFQEKTVVINSSGEEVPYVGRRIGATTLEDTRKWLPWQEKYIGNVDIASTHNLNRPGDYIVHFRYAVDSEGRSYAESQRVAIRIVPEDFLRLVLAKELDQTS